jgi:hypothetical protein
MHLQDQGRSLCTLLVVLFLEMDSFGTMVCHALYSLVKSLPRPVLRQLYQEVSNAALCLARVKAT